MITLEIDKINPQILVLTMDQEGVEDFLGTTQYLSSKISHEHFMSPAWGGDDMGGVNISGPEYDLCSMLTIHSMDQPGIVYGYGIDIRAYTDEECAISMYTVDIYGSMQGIGSLVQEVARAGAACANISLSSLFSRFYLGHSDIHVDCTATLHIQYVTTNQ